MTLNNSNSTSGYDVNELEQLARDINTECITPTIETLRIDAQNVKDTVNEVWSGKSAESFKNKVDRDTEATCKTLEEVSQMISGQINNIGSNVESYDEEIANKLDNE